MDIEARIQEATIEVIKRGKEPTMLLLGKAEYSELSEIAAARLRSISNTAAAIAEKPKIKYYGTCEVFEVLTETILVVA